MGGDLYVSDESESTAAPSTPAPMLEAEFDEAVETVLMTEEEAEQIREYCFGDCIHCRRVQRQRCRVCRERAPTASEKAAYAARCGAAELRSPGLLAFDDGDYGLAAAMAATLDVTGPEDLPRLHTVCAGKGKRAWQEVIKVRAFSCAGLVRCKRYTERGNRAQAKAKGVGGGLSHRRSGSCGRKITSCRRSAASFER